MTWIPVGERLPEPGVEVLVWGKDYAPMKHMIAEITPIGGYWCTVEGEVEVTHWQPLPEPPGKEGGVNEKLWLLRPANGLSRKRNPWDFPYEKALGFVVRADTEEAARLLAAHKAGDEVGRRGESWGNPWTDASLSTCTELLAQGEPGVIIRDYWAA